jgi:hypothetical protein
MSIDDKGLEIARRVADAIRAGADPESLFGTLLPVLLEMARDHFGRDELIAQLEATIAAWRRDDA